MIVTVADLLQKLVAKERDILAAQSELNHAPMLGTMYEGLTRDFLEKALFDGLDLRVVQGKARDSSGNLSGQLTISQIGTNSVSLSWPARASYYLPEYTSDLTTGIWQSLSSLPTTNSGSIAVNDTLGQFERFYRLKHQ